MTKTHEDRGAKAVMSIPKPHCRDGFGWLMAVGWMLLVGCAAAPVPPTTWLRLPAEVAAPPRALVSTPPLPTSATGPMTGPATASAAASATAPSPAAAREVWQLMLPLALPGDLDRDSLFVPQGASGAWVRPLAGARWVEPLRDAVPRVLREDLVRQLSGLPLWWSPLPPGLAPTHQLRIEITSFEITADGRAIATRARWSIADARGTRAPVVHEAAFGTPVTASTDPEAWAVAHRQAIAVLAVRIAATMALP